MSTLELEIYKTALKGADCLRKKLQREGHYLADSIDDEIQYTERQQGNQHIHLIGEPRYSRKSIEYVHQHVASKIKQDPPSWLFLIENCTDPAHPDVSPSRFYFQKLAAMYRLPCLDALADLCSRTTRAYITKKASQDPKAVDQLLLTYATDTVDFAKAIRHFIRLQKASDSPRELLDAGSANMIRFEDNIGKYWDECSKPRFTKICTQYADKSNILISVRKNHLFPFAV